MVPAIAAIRDRLGVPVSVDTWRAEVADASFEAGAVLGNDISGFGDPDYLAVAERHGASVVATHIRLVPRASTTVGPHTYPDGDVVAAVEHYLLDRLRTGRAHLAGLEGDQVIFDAGLALGTTTPHSLELRGASARLASLGHSALALRIQQGLSRRPRLRGCASTSARGDASVSAAALVGVSRLSGSFGYTTSRRPSLRRAHGARDQLDRGERYRPRPWWRGASPTWCTGRTPGLVFQEVGTAARQRSPRSLGESAHSRRRGLRRSRAGGVPRPSGAVLNACRTPPFLASCRIVVVRDVVGLDAASQKEIVAYLADPLETHRVLVLAVASGRRSRCALVRAGGHAAGTW